MPEKVERWRCLFCGTEYERVGEAERCERRGFPVAKVNPGTIITIGERAFNVRTIRQPQWTICDERGTTGRLLYVVTKVEYVLHQGEHLVRYHVLTCGLGDVPHHATYGYTHGRGQFEIEPYEASAELVAEAKQYVGRHFQMMLA